MTLGMLYPCVVWPCLRFEQKSMPLIGTSQMCLNKNGVEISLSLSPHQSLLVSNNDDFLVVGLETQKVEAECLRTISRHLVQK
jgi:hypothetical protein